MDVLSLSYPWFPWWWYSSEISLLNKDLFVSVTSFISVWNNSTNLFIFDSSSLVLLGGWSPDSLWSYYALLSFTNSYESLPPRLLGNILPYLMHWSIISYHIIITNSRTHYKTTNSYNHISLAPVSERKKHRVHQEGSKTTSFQPHCFKILSR